MKLRRFEDYEIDRSRGRVMLYVQYRGAELAQQLGAGTNDRIEVFRAVGQPNRYYVYSSNTGIPYLSVQAFDRESGVLNLVDEVFLQNDWEIEESLGSRWQERTPLTNTKKIIGMSYTMNPRKRKNNGRRYDYDQYIEFLYEIDSDQVPRFQKKAFEKEIDRVLYNSGYESLAEKEGLDEVYYLTLASLLGHGVGLWEDRKPWHKHFEKAVKYDLKATSKLSNAFYRLDEKATTAAMNKNPRKQKKKTVDEYGRNVDQFGRYIPDLMKKPHNGRPNNVSIAVDIAWNDILAHDFDFLGSARFKTGSMSNKSKEYKYGYFLFFLVAAEESRIPAMGFAGRNPSPQMVKKLWDKYLMSPITDLSQVVEGFIKAYQLVDQTRMVFYRAGSRPETWSG